MLEDKLFTAYKLYNDDTNFWLRQTLVKDIKIVTKDSNGKRLKDRVEKR